MPLPPSDPYQAEFAPTEYAARIQRLRARMQQASVDALLVSAKLHLRYLTGYRSPFWDMAGDIQLAILPADAEKHSVLVLPASYEFTAQTACVDEIHYARPNAQSPYNDVCDLAVQLLGDMGLANGTLGMDLDVGALENMPPAAFDQIRSHLPNARIVNAYPLILELRSIKSPDEQAALRMATHATARGLQMAFGELHAGMSKKEFGEILCMKMLETVGESCHARQWLFFLGAGQDMPTWCNFGATDYCFQAGDMIVADGGCTYRGYCADMMRWGCIGEPSRENQYLLDVVTEAMEAGKAVLRAGVTDGEVDSAMRRVIERSQIDSTEWQMAPFSGHGIGLEVHELPRILPAGETVFQAGMVISVEPLLLKQSGGRFTKTPGTWRNGTPPDMMVMEDNVIVTENGYELLSSIPTALWKG
ncbi:MAG TPA: Xaa-Pro peptidase family protein [Anaerolineae bacterium]|nr:Xaa-Pro peptidase family protein [Anaerolineae bacterium]